MYVYPSFQKLVQLILMTSLVCSCGGGDGGGDLEELTQVQPTLHVQLAPSGTILSCTAASDATLTITRTTGDVQAQVDGDCRRAIFLAGDLTPSSWSLVADTHKGLTQIASVDTTLPPPVVVTDGSDWIVLQDPPKLATTAGPVTLALIARDGHTIASFSPPFPARLSKLSVTEDTTDATWQWQVSEAGKTFASQGALDPRPTNIADYSFWGAMSIGDMNGDGVPELLGTLSDGTTQTSAGYTAALGLDVLFPDRVFRDVRQVDLDGDGREDIISNVYGGGCTMIGTKLAAGGYDYKTPTRADGSCLDGNGETILVADFAGTGRIDIMLPTYQRVDYLHNEGGGIFTEVADSVGLSYPAYLPTFEGTTAVDIDLNGTVDIVMGGEVLLNDGRGHFTRQVQPLGPNTVMQDEGLSVVDADNDGVFDIIKLHPTRGLRMLWGQADRKSFVDAGYWVVNAPLNQSYGLALGDFTGNALPDAIVSGGQTPGAKPQLCVQKVARQFFCLDNALPASKGTSGDLQMLTDIDGDGQMELINRDTTGMHVVSTAPRQRNVFRIDLRDAQGRRNMYGHTMRAICAVDQSLIQLKFVDGGNGYLSQSDYVVPFTSSWCQSAYIEVATMSGMKRFGPFSPGLTKIQVDPNATTSTS